MWTEEEDAILMDRMQNFLLDACTSWKDLGRDLKQLLPGRDAQQIKTRWVDHLNPLINRLPFSREGVSRI